MYQELISYPVGSKWENVFLILKIVLSVFVISVASWLLSLLGIPGADLIASAVVGGGACVIFMQRVVKFRYTLMEDDLIITRIVGSVEKNVLQLDVDHITSIDEVDKTCKLPTEKCIIPTKKLAAKQFIYVNDAGETVRVLLQPGEKLLERINIRLESNRAEGEE